MTYTILGVTGHIDHGKSTLARVLTGMDTDTHPEERRRGITIDLGFAACSEGQHRCALFAALRHQHAPVMLVDWIQISIDQLRGELSAGREMNVEQLPVLQMISKRSDSIQANCVAVRKQLSASVRERVSIIACQSPMGGGTLPGQTLPSFALAAQSPQLEKLARALRAAVQPIQSRLCDDRLILDLRTVDDKELNSLVSQLDEALCADATGIT